MIKSAEPIFKIYPYKLLINQSLQATATSRASQEFLRPAMERFSKAEFIHILMSTLDCLHYEPDYKINKPLLLIVGEKDITGNIRKVMPIWAEHEPDCKLVVIPNAKHAANLDEPDLFHRALRDFLVSLDRPGGEA